MARKFIKDYVMAAIVLDLLINKFLVENQAHLVTAILVNNIDPPQWEDQDLSGLLNIFMFSFRNQWAIYQV